MALSNLEPDIQKAVGRKAAAPFPAKLAIARLQAPDYGSYGSQGYGGGSYSVMTTTEQEEQIERIRRLPMIAGVVPVNQRVLLPPQLESIGDLRLAASSMGADLLLVYTLDTSFRVSEADIAPLARVVLGFAPIGDVVVASKASSVIYDVQSGFVYGVVEGTGHHRCLASAWRSEKAAEQSRLKAERIAFERLLDELEGIWGSVLREHAR